MGITEETIRKTLETSPVYHAGDLAYLKTCTGCICCVVQSVDVPGDGIDADRRGKLTVEITETKGVYSKGEIVQSCSLSVIPRSHRTIEGLDWKFDSFYHWR